MAQRPGPDLRSFTGFLLRRAYVRTVGVEHACIGDDARLREISVLIILDELGAVSQREVAELTHISPTVMVRLVDSLEQRGWVTRERNVDDRRAYALRLTTIGRTSLRRLSLDLDASDRQLTAALTAEEVERLTGHLRALLDGDPALKVHSMATRPGYLITHAHTRSRERAQEQMAGVDLHPRDFGLLSVIGRDEPCSQAHLAATIGVSDPAVLPALDALEARGWLTRTRNVDDRRLSDVRLTAAGRSTLTAAARHAAALQQDVTDRVGPEGLADLHELLGRVIGGSRRVTSSVPAAEQALAVLRHLARHTGPVPAATIARDLDLPRSTTYHLLAVLVREGFVVHLPEERRYGVGVTAFELGSAYARQAPLQRLARQPLARLVDATGHSAHLAVLHGRDVLYVVEERAPGRPPLVTDVGVRLPAQLTASGRSMLAALQPSQVRALFPDRTAFVERHGSGPASLSALRRLLTEVRTRGYAVEDGEVTPGFASVASAAYDHNAHPVAGVAITFPSDEVSAAERRQLATTVRATAESLTRRISGHPPQ